MKNARILVVDDDSEFAESVKGVLESEGYEVSTAGDREAGMERVKTRRPDLLILDIMMKSWLDGLDMAKKLKKDPRFNRIPILMLTGVAEATGIGFDPQPGGINWCAADAYVHKPVTPAQLLSKVCEMLGPSPVTV